MTKDTNTTSGAADLLDLIEAYAEARHRQGHSSYNAQTAAALQAVKDALAAGQATATQPAPVLWVSPEQFANFMDADEAQFGRYVPARKTCAGNFTMPLFAAPAQPAAEPANADRVQEEEEDAALWRWLAEYLVGTRTDLDDEIVASETVNDLRKLVKAAIKQGEKQ